MKKTNDARTGPVPDKADEVCHFLFIPVPDGNRGCCHTDAGVSFLDADAQLCMFVYLNIKDK
jgi:hypothetical protein